MDLIKKNMGIVLAVLLAVLALVVYINFFAGKGGGALLTSSGDSNIAVSQDLLVALTNLHTIKLDTSLFSDPAFKSLTSFGVQLPPENVGRRNPFEPVGAATN